MNHSNNESKVKQARKKSMAINRAARYDKIEKEPQDPKVIERWIKKTIRKDRRRIRSLIFGERRNKNDGQF